MPELNTEVLFTGEAKYAKFKQPDKFDKWSTRLYVDQTEVDKFLELRVKNELKKDEKGYYFTLSRPLFIKRKAGGQIPMAPPLVVDKNEMFIDALVGDGSKITCKCDYYGGEFQGMPWRAIRLKAVMVHELIPYTPSQASPDFKENIAGLPTVETRPRGGWGTS